MQGKDIEVLKTVDREVQLLSHTAAILGWDQETYMPSGSVEERSSQLSLLSSLIHGRITSDAVKSIFSGIDNFDSISFSDDVDGTGRAFVRKFFDTYRKQSLLPEKLVAELSRQASVTQHIWAKARAENSFSMFRTEFEKLLALVREKAECYGYENSPYDALLDEYEKGISSKALEKIFDTVEKRVVSLLEKISCCRQSDDSFLRGSFDPAKQDALGRKILSLLGYDENRGRMDISAHPFTTTLGFSDVRITTHYKKDYFPAGLYSIIHECGHALYEQGFDPAVEGTSLAEGTSLGIHESQSRFWENIVGRGAGFAEFIWPFFREFFPVAAGNRSHADYFRAVNRVSPSLIRINADEVTYNLHVIMRSRLEKALAEGELKAGELPAAWNDMSEKLLGVRPEKDGEGVLQDIHWSFGAIGYFPTYLLGNLYAAQFTSVLEKEIGPVDRFSSEGNFIPLLSWLRENIHRHGSVRTPDQLVFDISGKPLDPSFFLDYLDRKYISVYSM